MNLSSCIIRHRRLAAKIVCCVWVSSVSAADEASAPIAVFDWSIAETVLSLGPVATSLGNLATFDTWTGGAYTDANIVDIGVQTFPNMELLSDLSPQRILLAPSQTRLGQRLEGISPITLLGGYPYARMEPDDSWATFDNFTLEVGTAIDRQAEAEQLVRDTRSHLETLKHHLSDQPPLLIVQLVTEQHVRVYGSHSMFEGVLQQLGLNNAWKEKTNRWGYSLVPLRELFSIEDARLVVIESAFPIGIERSLETSGMWQYLPSVQRGDTILLPSSFWIAGTLPSARRFADALVERL